VVDDGENGLLVPFGDVAALSQAVARLLAEPEITRKMGEQGRAKVAAKYSWESVAGRAVAAFERALDR
jgi:glycosyltransferase involved in cell wall biosynthesis